MNGRLRRRMVSVSAASRLSLAPVATELRGANAQWRAFLRRFAADLTASLDRGAATPPKRSWAVAFCNGVCGAAVLAL